MILHKLRDFGFSAMQWIEAGEVDAFGERTILAKHFDRVRMARAIVIPVYEMGAALSRLRLEHHFSIG